MMLELRREFEVLKRKSIEEIDALRVEKVRLRQRLEDN